MSTEAPTPIVQSRLAGALLFMEPVGDGVLYVVPRATCFLGVLSVGATVTTHLVLGRIETALIPPSTTTFGYRVFSPTAEAVGSFRALSDAARALFGHALGGGRAPA